eukprot:TRINITY_DN102683_c0_g1_i1.p1 TRINITY_DN102683_c0_g1~~TRINITY_DN102683_c0_g1_i1.p1  ORF type:complete len:223 (-),score=71.71 TRINITY_DN102683_c0_g1_i1:29-697(-)
MGLPKARSRAPGRLAALLLGVLIFVREGFLSSFVGGQLAGTKSLTRSVGPRPAEEEDGLSGVKQMLGAGGKTSGEVVDPNVDMRTPMSGVFDFLFGKEEKDDDSFVDSSDESNYVTVQLEKPLGLGVGENEGGEGGAIVTELKPGASADASGKVQPGFQVIAVNDKPVYGLPLQKIVDAVSAGDGPVRLTFFKGDAEFFYGKLGPSSAWLKEFEAKLKSQDL